MFGKILIANRGEIALRIIGACKALGIESVAVYSTADADSPHLRQADQSICIGAAKSEDSYLNMEAILQAALQTEVQAIHPGYGFLAENPLFARLCNQLKVTFIGPSPRVIRLLGDKAVARRTIAAAGLPVIPGSRDVVASLDEAAGIAIELGYPVLLKAAAGGGGKGIRVCNDAKELTMAFAEAAIEAQKAFGDSRLYVEKLISPSRHIEFQFIADSLGSAVHLGERECSVQRHHQKLIEEAPSVAVDAPLRQALGEKVARAVAAIGYVGAGTMEFLRDTSGQLYFMEVNARVQVEHPVTEMITSQDLVQMQILAAANEPLAVRQQDIAWTGHAIECRINAEDPDADFAPAPGRITRFVRPAQTSTARVRIDTHVEDGYRIPAYYDSLLAKLIVHAPTRELARGAMLAALDELCVEGVRTTIPAHKRILADPSFVSGSYDTGIVARLVREKDGPWTTGGEGA